MTNEEAFEKWAIDYGLDYEPSFTRYDVEAAWFAAIAYMQEQSEPFGIWHVADDPDECEFFLYEDSGDVTCEKCVKLYTTPQRQQPLKRLDEDRIDDIFNSYSDEQGYVAIDDWHLLTNAIMDEMERINK